MRFEKLATLFCAAVAAGSLQTLSLPAFADPAVSTAPVPGGAGVPSGDVKVQIESMVTEGPLYEERGLLLKRINAAKAQGIGIAGYLSAFKFVEEMAKTNVSEDKIKERIAAVNKGLDEQAKRAVDLKNRPAAMSYDGGPGLSDSGKDDKHGGNPSASDIASQLKGQNPDSIIDKLKAKYGDRIPEGTDIEALKKKFMGDDRGKELLKRFQQ
ncbi:MAG: hypothetical protein IT343_10205 [Candidatus Melainabacteria bacterium]|jgi:hypothetical protein|nr:hypothetical protein [Candidatus Melainabacteria bacterium]